MSFARFIELVKVLEGGMVDDPRDPGGPTAYGITRATWLETRPGASWPPDPVEVASWYEQTFWTPYRCAQLPEPSDSVFGQLVINLPSNRRIAALQAAVGTVPDGKWGEDTTEAIKIASAGSAMNSGGKNLALLILAAQLMHYADTHPAGDWDSKGLFDRVYTTRKWMQQGRLGG